MDFRAGVTSVIQMIFRSLFGQYNQNYTNYPNSMMRLQETIKWKKKNTIRMKSKLIILSSKLLMAIMARWIRLLIMNSARLFHFSWFPFRIPFVFQRKCFGWKINYYVIARNGFGGASYIFYMVYFDSHS